MTVKIGTPLKEARRRALLTQFEVAVKAGVSPASVANAESNRPVSIKIARRLAEAMNIKFTAAA
jgi:transcriptional regulator with XRE-family HTH domain